MKIKETYTLDELCSSLIIPLVKFCQMAGITEATLIRLRKGYAGRQHTINSILATFSKVYGIELSLENVEGLTVQEKPHQKGKKPPVLPVTIDGIPKVETPQNRSTGTKKRGYAPRKTDLPEGCMLATDFARDHNIKRETFRDHINRGLGPGYIHGPGISEDGSILVRDYVKADERDKPNRPNEKEKYLTPEQQTEAVRFWQRHMAELQRYDVEPKQCDRADCPCHTLKLGE